MVYLEMINPHYREYHLIEGNPEGGYHMTLNMTTSPCYTGKYESLKEAEERLRILRPNAKPTQYYSDKRTEEQKPRWRERMLQRFVDKYDFHITVQKLVKEACVFMALHEYRVRIIKKRYLEVEGTTYYFSKSKKHGKWLVMMY